MDNQRVLLKMIKIYSTQVNRAKHNHFRPLPLVGALYIRTEEINSKRTLVSVGFSDLLLFFIISSFLQIRRRENISGQEEPRSARSHCQ